MKFLILLGLLLAAPAEAICIKDDNGEIISCTGDNPAPEPDPDRIPFRDRFFQYDEKALMAHTFVDDVPVILDADFIKHSVNSARFLTDVYELKHNSALFAIIERRDKKAVLVDKIGLKALQEETHAGCNRSQCTSVIIGGAMEGFVEGAALGATTGGLIGGPYGAATGAVIGGGVMSVGKSISGYGNADACNCPDNGGSGSNSGASSSGSGGGMGNDEDPKDKEIPKDEK
jgi:hypothetical protein